MPDELEPVNLRKLTRKAIRDAVDCGCCVTDKRAVRRILKYIMSNYFDAISTCRDTDEVAEQLRVANVRVEELYAFIMLDRKYQVVALEEA
jgi:hypothetical protein